MEFTECDMKFASEILKYRGDPRSIFKLLEADGDGELSSRELKNATERILKVRISEDEAEEMFADADWDGGGSISVTEFSVYLGMPNPGVRAELSRDAGMLVYDSEVGLFWHIEGLLFNMF